MNRQVAWRLTTRGIVLGLVAFTCFGRGAAGQQTNAPIRKAGAPAASPATAKAAPADAAAREAANQRAAQAMLPILTEWEKRSARIVSLDAVFDMVERSPGFGDQWYRGRAMLQSPDKACLQFQLYKLDADHKPIVLTDDKGKKTAKLEAQPEKRIVCTGSEVLQYMWENRTVTVYPLDKQAREKALQEGPLPFLFNMKASEASQRYAMWLYKEFEKEYVIDIAPRMKIDQDSFIQARLWLNKETFLPNQLWLVKNGGKEREEYKFNGVNDVILANQPMDQKYFQFQTFENWKTVVNQPDAAKGAAGVQPPSSPGQARPQLATPGGRTGPR